MRHRAAPRAGPSARNGKQTARATHHSGHSSFFPVTTIFLPCVRRQPRALCTRVVRAALVDRYQFVSVSHSKLNTAGDNAGFARAGRCIERPCRTKWQAPSAGRQAMPILLRANSTSRPSNRCAEPDRRTIVEADHSTVFEETEDGVLWRGKCSRCA